MTLKIVFSILSYLLMRGLFLWKPIWGSWLILIFVWLVIKDITLYIIQFKPIRMRSFDLSKLHSQYQQKQITIRYYITFLNRVYIFPLILTLYLVYLLISQTHIWDLQLSIRYLMIQENFLLLLTILSWLFLIVKENKDHEYIYDKESIVAAYWYYMVSVTLGLLSTYLIHQQVHDLEVIWTIIAIIAWILVFLVGVILVEDEIPESVEPW